MQFAWILGVVALAALLVQPSGRARSLARLAGAGFLGAAISAYAIVGLMIAGSGLQASASQLSAYRTSGDPSLGLFINVAGLYGFWRPGPTYPKNLLSGWPLLLFGILIIVTVGFTAKARSSSGRGTAVVLLISGVIGYFLALGTQGPTGALYRYSYTHVPGFQMLREPEKFSMLVALCYACGFGWGVDRLIDGIRGRSRRIAVGAAILALPCAYTPNLAAGLGGQIGASSYPASWQAVARMVQGKGLVLFLPWHAYQAFPFAGNRVVTTPAEQYFSAPILANEDAGPGYQFGQVDPEDPFISSVVARGWSVSNAGTLLSFIGVRWIILAKVNDWRSYGWLASQGSLHLVFQTSDLEVFKNSARPLVPERTAIDMGKAHGFGLGPGAKFAGPAMTHRQAVVGRVSLRQVSPVSYLVGPGGGGWFVLPIPYKRGWSLQGRPAVPLSTGNLAVPANRSGELSFTDWPAIFFSEIASLVAFFLGVIAAIRSKRHTATLAVSRNPQC